MEASPSQQVGFRAILRHSNITRFTQGGKCNYITYSLRQQPRKCGPKRSCALFKWVFNDIFSQCSSGRIFGRQDFGFGLKGVFKSVESMVKCPSSPAMTTDDIGHDLCHVLTLGRSTGTQFFDPLLRSPLPGSCSVLAVCRCKLLLAVCNSRLAISCLVLEVDLMKWLIRCKLFSIYFVLLKLPHRLRIPRDRKKSQLWRATESKVEHL